MPSPVQVSLALLAATLPAQTVHLVGPNGLPQIRDALALAVPGDVVHVAPGTYAHFTVPFGVTIRALVPGTVNVAYDAAFAAPGCLLLPTCAAGEGATRFAMPPGQHCHVVGLRFVPTVLSTAGGAVRHSVAVTGATVSLDDCTIEAQDTAALTVDDALLHLQGCVVRGTAMTATADALVATDARVVIVASLVYTVGGTAPAGDAVRLTNATLHAHDAIVNGGDDAFGGPGGAGVRTDAASRIWLADSQLAGGGTTCPVLGAPAIGHAARSLLQPAGGCPTLLDVPLVTTERLVGPSAGAAFAIRVRTEPGLLVALHASHGLATTEVPGPFAQPLGLDLTTTWPAGLFVSDANGTVTASWNLPAGAFLDEPLWIEPIALPPAAPILVGPAVGGVIR